MKDKDCLKCEHFLWEGDECKECKEQNKGGDSLIDYEKAWSKLGKWVQEQSLMQKNKFATRAAYTVMERKMKEIIDEQ